MTTKGFKSTEKNTIVNERPKRRLRVGDREFVPPDGGWGWLIVFACGFSNLSTFPMFQQFGLVFRTKFEDLRITETQTTTVINLNSAFNAGMGLINGPLFRKFSYRQVAMFGSCLVAGSLLLCTLCESFWAYIIIYSMLYGCGIGITQSSNALALNTYFREKRRLATGFSWTTTAFGPIIWPYIIVVLNKIYGMEGTLLLFAGFALHSFVCSLLLQPVEWHTKFKIENSDSEKLLKKRGTQNSSAASRKSSRSRIFCSQYLRNEDDPYDTGYEITDPGTPMMVRANDGWYSQSRSQFGSRISLSSNKIKHSSGQSSVGISKKPSYSNLVDNGRDHRKKERNMSLNKPAIREEVEDACNDIKKEDTFTEEDSTETQILKGAAKKLAEYQIKGPLVTENQHKKDENISIWKKISIFFDFDLFRDPVYLNLMLGITIANFAELNFSILTPIVLKEFKFSEYETATFMSLLGATDIIIRFFIPFIADKIGWTNKTFFLIGVMSMALGRIILVHTRKYYISLLVAVIIGAGKALRTIFMALVIPSYVPLERLPAASGLQLATSGLLFILLGPVVGWVRETVQNYVITLHILNICTYATAIAWTLERFLVQKKTVPDKSFESNEA